MEIISKMKNYNTDRFKIGINKVFYKPEDHRVIEAQRNISANELIIACQSSIHLKQNS
jgi:hypothetical protein